MKRTKGRRVPGTAQNRLFRGLSTLTGLILLGSMAGTAQADAQTAHSASTVINGPGRSAPAPITIAARKTTPGAPSSTGRAANTASASLTPAVVSSDGRYPSATTGALFNTPGKFTFSTSDGLPAGYVFELDQEPPPFDPSANETAPVTGVGGLAATPAGHWSLTEGKGRTAADSAGKNPATLSGDASWSTDPVRGSVLNLNGANASAVTSGPALATTSSYSLSVWVNLSSAARTAIAVGQDGAGTSGFAIGFDSTQQKWAFAQESTAGGVPIEALSAVAPTLHSWTHLVGTFDSTTGTMTLYVNDVAVGTATDTAPAAATGPLSLGRGELAGFGAGYLPGQLSDAQTYQRVLTPAEITSIYTAATVTITPLFAGPHRLYVYSQSTAGGDSPMVSYEFFAAADPRTSCANLAACMNNVAISSNSDPNAGDADGADSFSAQDLDRAGWHSGGEVTIDGATITLPQFGAGQPDNVLSGNQSIANTDPALTAYNASVSANSGPSSLVLLATSTNSPGASGQTPTGSTPFVPADTPVSGEYCAISTLPAGLCLPLVGVSYSDGSFSTASTAVPDWDSGPASVASIVLPHENTPNGQVSTLNPRIYLITLPLKTGVQISSVSLPDVGLDPGHGHQALHIFGMSTRSNMATAGAPGNETWTGAWASPTEGSYNFQNGADYSNQTFRVAVKPSVSGNSVRIKLDDALGQSPVRIGHVTVAPDSAPTGTSPPSAVPAAAPTTVTFGGSSSMSIPEGGMIYSDQLPFSVTAGQYLLVSYQLANSVPYLVENTAPEDAYEYVSAVGTGDTTTDTTGTPFTSAGSYQGRVVNLLADVDVATNNVKTEVVLGNNLIDYWQPNAIRNTTGAELADAIAASDTANSTPVGVIGEGIESNEVLADNPQTYQGAVVGGPSLMSRIDRDLLDQPNVGTAVLDEGLADALAGNNPSGFDRFINQYLTWLNETGVQSIGVVPTPCDGYVGAGGTPNDPCSAAATSTASVFAEEIENYLEISFYDPPWYVVFSNSVVGVDDPSNAGAYELSPSADAGDHVNLTSAGYAALATAVTTPPSS